MQLTISETALPLKHTFTIARGSSSIARTALLELNHDGVVGLGESSPTSRYHESIESIRAWFATHPPAIRSTPFDLETLLGDIPPAARCALDVAAHDWIGKQLGVPLWKWLGVDPSKTPCTSFTIGLDETAMMLEKLEAIRDVKIVKLKLGTARDLEIVEAIRSRYTGILRIDANEAWTPEETVRLLGEMRRFEIEFCEQPIPAGTPERLRWISDRSAIPIVTDEDSCNVRDIASLRGCVAGINIKLVKIGGIRAALDGIRTARALGLKVMLGCMVESSVLATAAAHISPLVDWADIDGPFLIAQDPYVGVRYGDSKLILPTTPGLGVTAASPIAHK